MPSLMTIWLSAVVAQAPTLVNDDTPQDGFLLRSGNGDLQLLVGGRVHDDWLVSGADDALDDRATALGSAEPFDSGTRFRRARIDLQGQLYGRIGFRSEFEFAQGAQVESTDTYISFKDLPGFGDLRVGHFKEPFSFEFLQSSNIMTFQEFSLVNAFSPRRNSGIGFANTIGERFHYAAGAFVETVGFGETHFHGGFASTARLAMILFENKENRVLGEAGVAFRYERLGRDPARFSTVSGSTLAPIVFDTGPLTGTETYAVDGNIALVFGRVDVTAEATGVRAVLSDDHTPTYWGYYVGVGCFLTGESRPFNPKAMVFGRVHPNVNVFDGGPGAIQVAARWSEVDLQGPTAGGRGSEMTGLLSWWLNPHARISMAYVRTNVYAVGKANLGQMRFQFDF